LWTATTATGYLHTEPDLSANDEIDLQEMVFAKTESYFHIFTTILMNISGSRKMLFLVRPNGCEKRPLEALEVVCDG